MIIIIISFVTGAIVGGAVIYFKTKPTIDAFNHVRDNLRTDWSCDYCDNDLPCENKKTCKHFKP